MKFSYALCNAFVALFLSLATTNSYSNENKFNLTDNHLSFVENKGQLLPSASSNKVLYYLEGNHISCFLKKNGLSYVWKVTNKQEKKRIDTYQMDLEFLNANTDVKIHSEEATACINNYFLPHCAQGILDVKSFHKIVYENVYDKIDLIFYVADGKTVPIKYDFIVRPGGDPKQIKINYIGNKGLKLKDDGSLTAYCNLGEVKEGKPFTYQKKNDVDKNEITSSYEIENKHVLSFNVSDYNKAENLIIDPTIQWSTYYGGSNNESTPCHIAADAAGNVYLAGNTQSTGLASTGAGVYQTSLVGTTNVMLVKFNSGGARQWATYFGGDFTDVDAIAVDGNGSSIYIAGITNATTGIAGGGFYNTFQTGSYGTNGYLAKFNSAGAKQWGTYYGGGDYSKVESVNVDHNNDVYLCGMTQTPTGVATAGTIRSTIGPTNYATYLVKFDQAGSRLWGTYFENGGYGTSVATDSQNNPYLAGSTNATTGISTGGASQPALAGDYDGFLVKLNPSGTSVIWGTYFGGANEERVNDIKIDASDNIYFSGKTVSTSGIASGGHQNTFGGGVSDGYLAKFNSSGVKQWATYYGGSDEEYNNIKIATYADGNVALGGCTKSTNNIATTLGGEVQTHQGGVFDGFVVKFNASGVRQWGTYLGGTGADLVTSLATHNTNLIAGGLTTSYTGISFKGFQNSKSGGFDMYVLKYGPVCADLTGDGLVTSVDLGLFLLKFGTACPGCPEDFNGDGVITSADQGILLLQYGKPCP